MSLNKIRNIKISGITSIVPSYISLEEFGDIREIKVRRSVFEQTSSDLAFFAANRLLSFKKIDLEEVGVILFISRTPDYRSPTTAAILQGRLGLSVDCICYDINKGNNGFNSGIITGASILSSINKKYGLILLGDTPSKLNHSETFFSPIESDAGTAILLERTEKDDYEIISFHQAFGEYFKEMCVPKGGFRYYDPSNLFDSTIKENFNLIFEKVNIQEFLLTRLQEFEEEIKSLIPENSIPLYHSQLALLGTSIFTKTNEFVLKEFGNTYSSNIPLQLEFHSKITTSQDALSFSCNSFGEGLELSSINFKINPSDILSSNISNDFFQDFRVNHEM